MRLQNVPASLLFENERFHSKKIKFHTLWKIKHFQISLTQKLSIVRTAIEIRRVRYGVLRSRLSFIIVLEAVFLHATSIGALDPHGKIHDVLPVR